MADQILFGFHQATEAIFKNWGWMSWNLFLALIPLILSFGLFSSSAEEKLLPRKGFNSIKWGVWLLFGVSFFPHLQRIGLSGTEQFDPFNFLFWIGLPTLFLILIIFNIKTLNSQSPRILICSSLSWWLGLLMFILFLPNAPYVLTDLIHLIADLQRDYSAWTITLAVIPQYIIFIVIGLEAYVLSLIYLNDYLRQKDWENLWIWRTECILHGLCAIGIYLGRFLRFNSWDVITQPKFLLTSTAGHLLGLRPWCVIIVTFLVLSIIYTALKHLNLTVFSPRLPVPN